MTIHCHEDFLNESSYENQGTSIISTELEHILGQVSEQVQEAVNHSYIRKKDVFERLLVQVLVQVKNNSKYNSRLLQLVSSIIGILSFLTKGAMSASELKVALGFTEIQDLKRHVIKPLINLGYIEMTNPEKPTSSKQRYKLTDRGYDLF